MESSTFSVLALSLPNKRMKLARYRVGGTIEIVEEAAPCLPKGGLLIKTQACGLCSGELMEWYMELKIPHVLGHEVAGVVVESDDDRFPVGARVFPHHHAPCLQCLECRRGRPVHCSQWKRTKLDPGGMAEYFAVAQENLTDTHLVDDLSPKTAALIEPLACVIKSLRRARVRDGDRCAVIGLGSMGLMHLLMLPEGSRGYDISGRRVQWARNLGLSVSHNEEAKQADVIIVCPGNQDALRFAIQMAAPDARIILFAPLPPGEIAAISFDELYFRDLNLLSSYSCGPEDILDAIRSLGKGLIKPESVVSDFIALSGLPSAYQAMKQGDILKAMVLFL